jgi:hypothetical protein
VNVAAVIQVAPPSSSFSSLGPAARPSLTTDPLGTFATLIDGLVTKGESSLLAGLLEEAQTDLASSGSHTSARPKGKDPKIEEAGVSTAKKNELKTKAGLVQTAEAVPPVVIQPPILFRALTWGTDSQASETSGNEPLADAGAQAPPPAAITPTTLTSPRTAASLPIENDAASARVAFGLRLTPLNLETSQVSRSRSESLSSVGLEVKANTAMEASGLPAQVQAAAFAAANPDHSRDDQPAPSAGNLHAAPSPATLTNPAAFSRFEDVSAANPGRAAQTLSSAGDPAQTEPLNPAKDPVAAPAATQAQQPDPSGIEQSAPQESNTNRGPELESVPTPPARSVIQIAQLANHPILPDDSGNQRLISKNSVAGTPARHEDPVTGGDAVTGDARAPKEAKSQTSQRPRLALESDNEESSPIPWRREINVESKPDSRAPRTASERAVQPVAAPGELDAIKAKSTADAADLIQSQAAESPLTTPRTTPSRPITPETNTTSQTTPSPAQTAALQATSSQTTPSGGASRGAASSKTTAAQASANPAITNQAMTNQAPSSQLTASQAVSQSTASQQSASQSMKGANEIEVSPGSQLQPARQISLKLIGEDATKVSVDVSERGGKVQIAVRSADPELAKTLRSDLGDLVGRLEGKGFKTEAWVPTTSRHTLAAAAEQSDSHNNPGNPRDTGSGTQQRQGRQGQNGSNQRQQARWMAQLEETIAIDETRTENK